MATCAPSDRAPVTGAPARIVALAFVWLVCGSNAMTPLLPVYTEHLRLSPLDGALVFCGYFAGLIGVLLVGARTTVLRRARPVLVVALAVAIVADLTLVAGAERPLLLALGRILVGAGVALGTGSSAALMVIARGEAGRAFIAGGAMVGACAGLILALAVVTWLPGPTRTIYLLHGAGCLLILITILIAGARPGRQHDPAGDAQVPTRIGRARHAGALLSGGVGWSFGALAVGALPATLTGTGLTPSLLAAVGIGALAMLASCAAIALRLGSPGATGWPLATAAGWATVALGVALAQLPLVVAGAVVGGVGQAAAYRSGLRRVTVGLPAERQGRVASGFSAFAYASCAAALLLTGVAQLLLGPIPGLLFSAGALLLIATLAVFLSVSGQSGASGTKRPSAEVFLEHTHRPVGATATINEAAIEATQT